MASKMYPFINYRDSIHYRNSCSATIVIVKFLLSLSTTACISRLYPQSYINYYTVLHMTARLNLETLQLFFR